MGPFARVWSNCLRASDSGKVTFRGRLPQTEAFKTMSNADLLLVPSVTTARGDTEGVPNVLKEAAARMLAIVGTRHGGIPEVVCNGATGVLVPERDVPALVNALQTLLTDPELRSTMGRAARTHMEESFGIKERIVALERHYDEVIADYARRNAATHA